MKPACGPPSSLSPEKVTRSAPSATASATVGSCATPKRHRSTRVPTKIVDKRHLAFVGQYREVARTHLFGEAFDAIVRGMHLEDQARFWPERTEDRKSTRLN